MIELNRYHEEMIELVSDGLRVGDNRPMSVDVRIITATNRILSDLISQGQFREDLFFRINVVPIHLPPPRKRRENIPLLVETFISRLRQKPENRFQACTWKKRSRQENRPEADALLDDANTRIPLDPQDHCHYIFCRRQCLSSASYHQGKAKFSSEFPENRAAVLIRMQYKVKKNGLIKNLMGKKVSFRTVRNHFVLFDSLGIGTLAAFLGNQRRCFPHFQHPSSHCRMVIGIPAGNSILGPSLFTSLFSGENSREGRFFPRGVHLIYRYPDICRGNGQDERLDQTPSPRTQREKAIRERIAAL